MSFGSGFWIFAYYANAYFEVFLCDACFGIYYNDNSRIFHRKQGKNTIKMQPPPPPPLACFFFFSNSKEPLKSSGFISLNDFEQERTIREKLLLKTIPQIYCLACFIISSKVECIELCLGTNSALNI
uniref:Uncharacterized protein n=1 Tax=Cacopsylla melanoneura TaxID=428564 RepID=A0A8D8TGI0_9HEMI